MLKCDSQSAILVRTDLSTVYSEANLSKYSSNQAGVAAVGLSVGVDVGLLVGVGFGGTVEVGLGLSDALDDALGDGVKLGIGEGIKVGMEFGIAFVVSAKTVLCDTVLRYIRKPKNTLVTTTPPRKLVSETITIFTL